MTDPSTPATKADINALREELRIYYATKADLAQMESRLTKWMVGLMVGSIAVASTLTLVVERLLAG